MAFGVMALVNVSLAIDRFAIRGVDVTHPTWAAALFLMMLATMAIEGFRLWREFSVHHADSSEIALEGILTTLMAQLIDDWGGDATKLKLRMCVHVQQGDGWTQKCHYVGFGKGTGRGQRQDVSKGVVGCAFREQRAAQAKIKNGTDRVGTLVKLGYTREEAEGMRRDAQSWIAVPIGSVDEPHGVFAVLFADCAIDSFFDKKYSFRRKALHASVIGIAEFVVGQSTK